MATRMYSASFLGIARRVVLILLICGMTCATPLQLMAQQLPGRATLSDGTMIAGSSLDGSVISSSPIVGAGNANIAVPLGLSGSYIWLQRLEGEGPGFSNTHRTTVAGFVPIQLSDVNILFLDGRVSWVNGNEIVYNGGIGFRHYAPAHDRYCGISLWYDVDDSRDPRRFEQYGLNFESRGENWDFFANYYEPEDNERQLASISSTSTLVNTSAPVFQNNNIVVTSLFSRLTLSTFDVAMKGYDLEFGGPLPFIGKSRDVRGYLGFYRFESDDVSDLNGASLRINANVGGLLGNVNAVARSMTWDALDEIRAQFMLTHDQTFSTSVMFAITFNMPGGASPSTRNRMREPVKRNMQVVVARQEVRAIDSFTNIDALIDPITMTPIIVVHADSTAPGGGDGTFENPLNNLNNILANSAPGDIVLAYADSVFNGQGAVLQSGQRFLGEGPLVNHMVDTLSLGLIPLPAGNPGGVAQPMIINSPGNAVTVANGTEVIGFDINNAGGAAIFANGVTGNVIVSNNTIDDGNRGIEILNSTGLFTFTNTPIGATTSTTGNAFHMLGGSATIDFAGNITNNSGRLIHIENQMAGGMATFHSGMLTDLGGDGINIQGSAGLYTIQNATITNPTGIGVNLINNAGATTNFLNLDVTTDMGTGLFANNAGTVNVTGTSLIDATNGAALDITNTTIGMTFDSLDSTTSGTQGINLNAVNGSLSVNNTTTVTNSTNEGIRVINSPLFPLLVANFGDTTVNKGGTAGVGVLLNNNPTAMFQFTDLDITTSNGNGLVGTDTGFLNILGGDIIAVTGAAVSLDPTSGNITFDSLTSMNSPTDGVFLDQFNGTFRVLGLTDIDNVADDGIQISNSTVNANFFMVDIDVTGDNGIELFNNPSTGGSGIVFNDGEIDGAAGNSVDIDMGGANVFFGVDITNTVNRAVEISDLSGGSAIFTGAISDTGAGGTGILVENSAFSNSVVSFIGPVDLMNLTSDAVTLDGNEGATISFFDLDITTTGATGFVATNNGTVNVFQDVGVMNTIVATNGIALDIENSSGDLTFTTLTSTSSPAEGIDIDNFGSTLTVTGTTTIDDAAATSIAINDSDGTFDFGTTDITNRNGVGISLIGNSGVVEFGITTIANPNAVVGDAVVILNATNGSVIFEEANINDADENSISVTNSSIDLFIDGGTIDNSGDNGLHLVDMIGQVDLTDMSIENSIENGILVSGTAPEIFLLNTDIMGMTVQDLIQFDNTVGASLTIIGGVFEGSARRGININNTSGMLDVDISLAEFNDIATDGLFVRHTGNGDVIVDDNTWGLTTAIGGNGVDVGIDDGIVQVQIDDNDLTGVNTDGIVLTALGDSEVNATVTSNELPTGNTSFNSIVADTNATLRLNLGSPSDPVGNNTAAAGGYTLNNTIGGTFELGGSLNLGTTFMDADGGNVANNGNTTNLGAPNIFATGDILIIDPVTVPLP